MPRAVFTRDATAIINKKIAKAPLYARRPAAPGPKRVMRFLEDMEHFSQIRRSASLVRGNAEAMRSIASYAIDLKNEYSASLLTGSGEPAVEMANALHGPLFSGMCVRSDILLIAQQAKPSFAKNAKAAKRRCTVLEIGLGTLSAAASVLLGYWLWHEIAASGGSNFRIAAFVAAPTVALLVFGMLCLAISKLEEKAASAACSKGPGEIALRAAANAWKDVGRMAAAAIR